MDDNNDGKSNLPISSIPISKKAATNPESSNIIICDSTVNFYGKVEATIGPKDSKVRFLSIIWKHLKSLARILQKIL